MYLDRTTRRLPRVTKNKNLLLLIVCLAQFMVILDVSIVNVALPSIKDALGFSTTGLQWVLNAYTLTFAGFLLLGGRAADLFGRRRMFYLGTLLFSGASLLCAIALLTSCPEANAYAGTTNTRKAMARRSSE